MRILGKKEREGRYGKAVVVHPCAGAVRAGSLAVPGRSYFLPGLLGSLPRVACATALGAALWDILSKRFWLSLGAGAVMTAAVLWSAMKRKKD